MRALLARQLALALLTVVAAHALTIALIQVLPTSAQQLLGLFGVRPEVLSALAEVNQPRSYSSMISGYLRGDFGVTADGVPVGSEVLRGVGRSFPRLGTALVLALVVAFSSAYFVAARERGRSFALSYLVFFPPYGIPFVVLVCVLFTGVGLTEESPIAWVEGVVAIVVTPAAMLALQANAVMRRELKAPHSSVMRVNGVSAQRLRLLLFTNIAVELTPSIEKVVASTLVGLMFSELVLGLPGVGALAVRAVRRSDVELLAAIVVVFSVVICTARTISAAARHAYGLTK